MSSQSPVYAFDCSVIIPTADRGKLISKCLASVLSQTVKPVAIIVVDNGIGEAIIPEEYQDKIFLVRTAPRIGPGSARNVGAQAAASQVLAFLDDDDLWRSDYLERVFERFGESSPDAVLGQLMRRAENSEVVKPYKIFPDDMEGQRRVFYSNPGFGGQNLTIRRDVFLELGGFDENMPASEDRDLAARLLLAGKHLVSQPSAVAVLCDHAGGRARHSLIKGNWAFIKKHWRHMHLNELHRALKVLAKRRILLLLGR